MDGADTNVFGLDASSLAIIILAVVLALWVAYTWYYGGVTVPLPSYALGFRDSPAARREVTESFLGGRFKRIEPFGGVAHGAGSPSCLRSSSDGAQLVDIFANKNSRFEEGPDTLKELTILIGKLSCFKKDLVSPSFIVNATRGQPYTTAHDIEPVAETTGRCFAKTIGPRDLTISLDKWNSRGEALVKKLCTTYSLTQDEVNTAQSLLRNFMRDISEIARSSCLQGEPTISGNPGPRDAHPYEKPELVEFGTYDGYY
jgi:hypothetical protein